MDPNELAELDDAIWTAIGDEFCSLTVTKLMSAPFWIDLHEQHRLPTECRSPFDAQRRFVGQLLHELWRQPLKPVARKMTILEELGVELGEKETKWLKEKDGVEVELTAAGRILVWRIQKEESTPRIRVYIDSDSDEPSSKRLRSRRKESDDEDEKEAPRTPNSSNSDDSDEPPLRKRLRSSFHTPTTVRTLTPPSSSRRPFDDAKAWKYILKTVYSPVSDKWRHSDEALKGIKFWEKFIGKVHSKKTAENWSSHYRKMMEPRLYSADLPIWQRLGLYKYLGIEVDEEAIEALEDEGGLEIFVRDGKIVGWKKEE